MSSGRVMYAGHPSVAGPDAARHDFLIDAQPGGIVARDDVHAYTALAVRGADRTPRMAPVGRGASCHGMMCTPIPRSRSAEPIGPGEWRPSSTGSDEANT